MKQGKTIAELSTQLQDIRENARDIILPANKLDAMYSVVSADAKDVELNISNGGDKTFSFTNWSHQQNAIYSDIPKTYYDRLRIQNAFLLSDSINHGFAMAAQQALLNKRGGGRMVRAYKNEVRGLVSSSYRTLDNFDLFEAVAPSLIDLGFEPQSCELTEKRFYLKVVSPKVEAEVKQGDIVQYGLVVSGSDVGCGSVRIEPLLYRLVCSNGMITTAAIKKAHLGRNMAGDNIAEYFSESTNKVTDQAFWSQVRDVVQNFAKPEFFEREVNLLREAEKQPIINFDLPEIVERTARSIKLSITDESKQSIIDNLAQGSDGAGMNKWGLANAFTNNAKSDSLDYDTATDFEKAGSKIINLKPNAWRVINEK